MINVAGLDLSYTGTGVAVVRGDKYGTFLIRTSKKTGDHIARAMEISGQIIQIFNATSRGPDLVVIEGPSFGSYGSALVELGMLQGVVRADFVRLGIRYEMVAPSTLRKFITGKGNSSKGVVIAHVYKEWKVLFHDDNEAEAYGLAMMAKARV